MDYSHSKEIIHETKILDDSDTAFIDQHIGTIQHNWEKNQKYRTETEMRISVLNDMKFPTPAAKYWQAVREQSAFYAQLVSCAFMFQTLQVDQEQLRRDIERLRESDDPDADLEIRRKEIEFEQNQFKELSLRNEATDRMREIRLWAQIMDECREVDPTFDAEDPSTHQPLSYVKRWRAQAAELGDNASPSERWNLLGQLQSGERYLKDKSIALPPSDGATRLTAQDGNVTYKIRFDDIVKQERKGNAATVRREQH